MISGAISILFTLTSCSLSAPSRNELVNGARSLVPSGSDVLREEEADCVELAPSPSCVHIYFVADETMVSARIEAVDQRAQGSGWTSIKRENLPGGSQLRYRREDLGAVVSLWNRRALKCRKAPHRCADVIAVEGIE
jgi:hypothetical protein